MTRTLPLLAALAGLVATAQDPRSGGPDPITLPLEQQLTTLLPTPDATAEARAANLEAYRWVYLDWKPTLFEEHAGDWLVIAGGQVFPRNARGKPAPSMTLEPALAAAEAAHPDAPQRFVFRVGEEGDLYHHPTVSGRPDYMGTQQMQEFAGSLWITPESVYIDPLELDGKLSEKAVQVGHGNSEGGGPELHAMVTDPGHSETLDLPIQLATGYSGHLVLGPDTERALGLARWEIPGSIHRGRDASGSGGLPLLRRAHVRLVIQSVQYDAWTQVGLRD